MSGVGDGLRSLCCSFCLVRAAKQLNRDKVCAHVEQHDTREPTFSKNARGPGTGTLDARFSVSVVGWKNPEQRYQGSPARPTAISKDQGLLRNDKLTLRMEGGEE